MATTLAVTVGLTLLLFGLVNNYIWKPTARVVPQFFGFDGFTFLGVHSTGRRSSPSGRPSPSPSACASSSTRPAPASPMRGVVDNRPPDRALRRPRRPLPRLSWSIGASLASVAGILVAPRLQLQPLILTLLVIDAYAAAVIGRLRSLPMTFLGAPDRRAGLVLRPGLRARHRGSGPRPRSRAAHPVGALDPPLRRSSSSCRRTASAPARPSAARRWRRPLPALDLRGRCCSWRPWSWP